MTPKQLAAAARKWRGEQPARVAAEQLGIPLRTWQGIEQERGFPYPDLLKVAFTTTTCKPETTDA